MSSIERRAVPTASRAPQGVFYVFDMEWTTWEGAMARRWSGPGEHREVVQIGAVRLRTHGGRLDEIASFTQLVRPSINPVLSGYFPDLTGISQAMIDAEGMGFSEALAAFSHFIAEGGPVYSNGGDEAVLAENCRLRGLPYTLDAGRFRNAHPLLIASTGLPSHTLVSGDLPRLMGLDHAGSRHEALTDARALARTLFHLDAWE